jgi:hypothetical protein
MVLPITTPFDPRVLAVGIVIAALLVTLLALALRLRRKRRDARLRAGVMEPFTAAEPAVPVAKLTAIDSAALIAAVKEAEVEGASHRLPGLYMSLAQWRLTEGEPRAAAELYRKCIREATVAGQKEMHARARVALGDMAQGSGDASTACEHWQIARLIFHELRQTRDYEAVDVRMQRNKCPTDWVLTDF